MLHFWNLYQYLKILKKKTIVTTNVNLEFKTAKDVVRQASETPRFRALFDSQHVKGSQKSVKFAWKHFYHNSLLLWAKLIWKMSLLVICEILRAFVNTLTVNGKYPFRNCENLKLPIQMQLSKNGNFSLNFFLHFWNLQQFWTFWKKGNRHRESISEITDCERLVYTGR